MEITPLHDRVLVQRAGKSEEDSGGLFIPKSDKDQPNEGTVIAVGPGLFQSGTFVETTVKVGNRVLFGKYTGDEVTVGAETYLIMPESQILAVIGGAQ